MNWKRNLYAIWVAELLAIAGFNTSMPIIPFYIEGMGVHDPNLVKLWVGLIQSASAVSMGLIAPVWGRMADSYGRRIMLLRAMFGGMVVIAMMGFVTSPWELLTLRVLQGLLTGTIAAATVLVATTVPQDQAGYGMGLLQTAVFVGATVGPMIGGVVADAIGYRFTFFVTAAMLGFAGLSVWMFVEEEFRPPAGDRVPFLKSLRPDFSVVMRSRLLIYLLAIGFSVQIANAVVNPIMPLFIQSISPDQSRIAAVTGLVLGVGAFSSALSAAGVGKVSYRLGYSRSLIVCMVGAIVLQIPQAFVVTTTQLLVLRLFTGFFLGGAIPSINALIANYTDKQVQGSVYGINTSVSAAGVGLGPAVGAAVAVWFGYPSAFFATAAVLAGGAAVVVLFMRREPPLVPAPGAKAGLSQGTARQSGGAAPPGVPRRPRVAWKPKD